MRRIDVMRPSHSRRDKNRDHLRGFANEFTCVIYNPLMDVNDIGSVAGAHPPTACIECWLGAP